MGERYERGTVRPPYFHFPMPAMLLRTRQHHGVHAHAFTSNHRPYSPPIHACTHPSATHDSVAGCTPMQPLAAPPRPMHSPTSQSCLYRYAHRTASRAGCMPCNHWQYSPPLHACQPALLAPVCALDSVTGCIMRYLGYAHAKLSHALGHRPTLIVRAPDTLTAPWGALIAQPRTC